MNIDWKNTDREFCKNELVENLKSVSEEDFQKAMTLMGSGDQNITSIEGAIESINEDSDDGKKQVDAYIKAKKMMKKMKKFGINPNKLLKGL